jgi:flagellar M-ring protein FliF
VDEKKNVMERALERWRELSRPRQITIAVIFVALLISLVLFLSTDSKPEYVALYSNLEPAQASPLIQYLKEQNIPYVVEDFGTAIAVPADRVDELRIEMAGKGMPFTQGLGFEIFDEESLGTTDFERQVKMQRALQEELRRTITSLDAIMQARVHLSIPEPQLFMREKGDPSAAIYLKLNPFVPLKEEQIKGIVLLVASSVENLRAENVVVIDSAGNMLYDVADGGDIFSAMADSSLKQLEIKRSFELELERRVQGMLEKVFGAGRALALVTADLDFDARELTVITYDEEGVPRSTQIIEENFDGEGAVLGEVGEANYPGYVGLIPGGESHYDRREEIINSEISETTERVIAAPGKLLGVHTSVVVDTGKEAMPEDQLEQIRGNVRELVSAAIGLDEQRGDSISVQGMSFDTTFIDEMEASFAKIDEEKRRQENFRQAVLGGAVLITLIMLLLALRRRRILREQRALATPDGVPLESLLGLQLMDEEFADGELVPGDTARERAQRLAEENPEAAVAVFRAWLTEE